MDGDDFPLEETLSKAAQVAAQVMTALESPEVQETLTEWSRTTFSVIRAFERADVERSSIAGMLGGSIIDVIRSMDDEG